MKKPYISIIKLAEYISATPIRRRQIIKALKEDSDFKKNYYQLVKSILLKYFKSNYDEAILDQAIIDIKNKSISTKWDVSDTKNSIEAIECLRSATFPDLTNYDFVSHPQKIDNIILADVKVTLKPEIYLINKKTGKFGAIKFSIAKTKANRLNISGLECASTGLKYGLISLGVDPKNIDNKACIVIDVFDGCYSSSPTAYKRAVDELVCSCQEIASRWDTI